MYAQCHNSCIQRNLVSALSVRPLPPHVLVHLQEATQQVGLHISCALGHKEIVKVLFKHRASVNIEDCDGCTPLYLAASAGNYEIAKMIVALPDCDIHTVKKVRYDGATLCSKLLKHGDPNVIPEVTSVSVLYFLDQPGDPHQMYLEKAPTTYLIYICMFNIHRVGEYQLEHKAVMNYIYVVIVEVHNSMSSSLAPYRMALHCYTILPARASV